MSAIRLDAHGPEFLRKMPPQLPVRVATTGTITIATALNSGDTIDGVTLATGDRVLVKDQSTGSQNGIYEVGASPERSFDFREGRAAYGALIWVVAGTTNGQTLWVCTNATVPTIDTTALTFAEFSSGSSVDVGIALYQDHGAAGTTETINQATAVYHRIELDANCTLTFSGAVSTVDGSNVACEFLLGVDTGAGGFTLTLPASVVNASTLLALLDLSLPDVVYWIPFWTTDGGTSWYWSFAGSSSLADHDHSADGAQGGDTLSPAVFLFPAATSPAQTADGSAVWDSNDDILTVGDGSSRKSIGYLGSTTPLVESGSGASGSSSETSRADHVHPVSSGSLGNAVGPILISDDHSTPILFADILLTEEEDDILYADP